MSISGGWALRILEQAAARESACCIAFADDVQKRVEAGEAGADVVLLKGYPAAHLVKIIEGLPGNQLNDHDGNNAGTVFNGV